MTPLKRKQQTGATLLVALVLLAVVIVLTVTNMREVTLEGRMTANRAETQQLQLAAESALREAEKRYYDPGRVEEKLTEVTDNCRKSNVYTNQANRPCLITLSENLDLNLHQQYQENPLKFVANSAYLNNWTGDKTDKASDTTFVPWMPYRGTSPGQTSTLENKAYWNSVLIPSQGIGAEYGSWQEGAGVAYYLITAQADDRFALQSTIANLYLGINN
ncbi:pilus assembly PilX family protein [Pseudomonas fluvialis]|uniref:pilus assembly PilX family protein n=1 Tax=Pseudomonas fluvialis TaxID=1793966 RepID=UPI00370A96FB